MFWKLTFLCKWTFFQLLFLLPLFLLAQPRAGIRVGNRVLGRGETIQVCVGSSITYFNEASGNITSIRWRFSNGTPATSNAFSPLSPIMYNTGGIDTTWQVVTDGSRFDSTFILVRVNTLKPSVNFSHAPEGQCASTPIVFTNGTTGGTGIRYVWNFGDGRQGSTQANPTRVFETNPSGSLNQSFTVKLVATNDATCSDSVTKTVTVRRTPDPSIDRGDPNFEFIPNFNGVPTFRRCENIPNYEFEFKNATTTLSQITRYTITWGDGSPDTTFTNWPLNPAATIKHTFPRGNTSMTVRVEGADGCAGVRVYNVFVGTTPAGGFASRGNTSICAPNALTFSINETENNAPGTQYRVTVNDGSPVQVFSHPAPTEVTHVFQRTSCRTTSSNGAQQFTNSYFAVLDVQNPCGTTSVSVIPIYVSGKPKASFFASPSSDICVNNTISFLDANVYGGKITPTGGTSASCDDDGKLVWSITPSTGYTITFGQQGSVNGRPENGFFWTNGTRQMNVRFTQVGTYRVKIYAANDLCGVDSTEQEICVRNPPTASFVMDKKNGCAPAEISINNTSPEGTCGGERYSWIISYADLQNCGSTNGATFINGTNSASKSPQIRFANPGRYIIELQVFTRASGCLPAVFRDTFFAVAKPKVDLGSITGLCAGNQLTPQATVSNCYGIGNPTYLWTFTGGQPASSDQAVPPAISYNANGSFPVTLAVTNDCGTTTVTRDLLVGPRPVANAGPDREVCSGIPINIGMAAVSGVSYSWSPLQGLNNANTANPTVNFSYSGPSADTTLTFIMRAFTALDCFNTDTVLVTVKRGPVVSIAPVSTTICVGGSAILTASGADTYQWLPPTGLQATDVPVVTAAPTITTTYTVTGLLANGCSATAASLVNVTNRPNVQAGRDTIACNNAPNIVLNGSPSGGNWSGSSFVTSGGIFNPRAAGNGTYTLYYRFIANNCDGIDSMVVTIQDPPAANAGLDTSVCADGSSLVLTGTPLGGTWSGSPLVSAAGIFTTSTPGTYNLIYARGSGSCIGYDTVKVTVVNAVTNNTISASQGVCGGVTPLPLTGSNATAGGLALRYQWQSSLDSINWVNIDGETGKDLVIPEPVQTIFYRRLASTSVCVLGSPSNGVRIFIHPNALATLNPAQLVSCPPFVITPLLVNHTAHTDRNGGFRWFANNRLIGSTQIFPGFTISSPDDSVTIKLVANSRFGCLNDSVSIQFKTLSNPIPDFTLSDTVGCGPLNISIINNTPKPERYSFFWNFGQGTTFTGVQPGAIVFPINPNLGDTIYTVVLRATGGCDTLTVSKKIRVRAKPRTLFTPNTSEGCSPFRVTFNNNSAGSNAGFVWDFGDGTPRIPANAASVTHTYFTGTRLTFRVRLFGTNDCGTDTANFNLIVNPNAVKLDFAVNGNELNGCAPHTVRFINNTTGANLFRWNFGDGSPELTTTRGFDTVIHTFTDTGRYVVTLFGSNGCSDTSTTEIITVAKRPSVSFTAQPISVCLGLPIQFNNTSTAGLAFVWDFGDGTTSSVRQPQKIYTKAGSYKIVLTGIGQTPQGFNCSDSAVATVNVLAPTGDLRYRGGYYCEQNPVNFTITNTNATRFIYYFGNGDSLISNSSNINYTYGNPGNYLPRVKIFFSGCEATLITGDTIRVDKTDPGFLVSFIQQCGETEVRFTDTSKAFFGITTRRWLFGDGTGSILVNPIKRYNRAGTYNLRLQITGISGCIDSVLVPLRVELELPPDITIIGDTAACTGQEASFTANDARSRATVFNWLPTGGNPVSGTVLRQSWPQPGVFPVTLIARTPFGCSDTAQVSVRVNPVPLVNAGMDITICRGQGIALSVRTSAPLQWLNTQGLSCSDCFNPIASPLLTTRYVVRGTNSFGCSITDTILVNVAQPFRIQVTPNDTLCGSRNETAQLFASNANRYQWNPGLGLSAADIPNPIAAPRTTTTYRVVGFDAENCFTDTAFVTVAVGFNPTVQLPAGSQVVAGTQLALNPVLSGGPFKRYSWTPNRDLSCNNCPNPVATINNAIRYTLEVETIYGCTASDTAAYSVICQQDQVFIPNAFSPDNDGINDVLMVRGKGVAMVKSFRIFNRFGQVVFEKQNFAANDPASGWNGMANGVPASPDVYVYTAEVICTAGAVYTYKGNITLFK